MIIIVANFAISAGCIVNAPNPNQRLAPFAFIPNGVNGSTGTYTLTGTANGTVLLDASKLGETVKEGKNQRTVLTPIEEQLIIDTFNNKQAVDDLSVVVTKKEIEVKNYSFSAGQYFEVKIEHVDITPEEFAFKMKAFESNLESLFAESKSLEMEIQNNLKGLKYE